MSVVSFGGFLQELDGEGAPAGEPVAFGDDAEAAPITQSDIDLMVDCIHTLASDETPDERAEAWADEAEELLDSIEGSSAQCLAPSELDAIVRLLEKANAPSFGLPAPTQEQMELAVRHASRGAAAVHKVLDASARRVMALRKHRINTLLMRIAYVLIVAYLQYLLLAHSVNAVTSASKQSLVAKGFEWVVSAVTTLNPSMRQQYKYTRIFTRLASQVSNGKLMAVLAVQTPVMYVNVRSFVVALLPALIEEGRALQNSPFGQKVAKEAHFLAVKGEGRQTGGSASAPTSEERQARYDAGVREKERERLAKNKAAIDKRYEDMVAARGAVRYGVATRSGFSTAPAPVDPTYRDRLATSIGWFNALIHQRLPGAHDSRSAPGKPGYQEFREVCSLLEFQNNLDGVKLRPDFLYTIAELASTPEGYHAVKTCFLHNLEVSQHSGGDDPQNFRRVKQLLDAIPVPTGRAAGTTPDRAVKTLLLLMALALVSISSVALYNLVASWRTAAAARNLAAIHAALNTTGLEGLKTMVDEAAVSLQNATTIDAGQHVVDSLASVVEYSLESAVAVPEFIEVLNKSVATTTVFQETAAQLGDAGLVQLASATAAHVPDMLGKAAETIGLPPTAKANPLAGSLAGWLASGISKTRATLQDPAFLAMAKVFGIRTASKV